MGWITNGLSVGAGGWWVANQLMKGQNEADLHGQVALVTGGSRGLGLLIAQEFAREGCKIAICARDYAELQTARAEILKSGADVFIVKCDVSNRAEVESMVAQVTNHYGQIDLLVNNAGIIEVGAVQDMTIEDFEEAMGIDFWGVVYATLAVLPQMRTRKAGRIVNITSFGGKVAVPHLLPYSAAKFAAHGFSLGLNGELAQEGITVTAIAPTTLRTGSYVNVPYKGDAQKEFNWFSLGASVPGLSMSAERAARQVVEATKRGEAERILGLQAVVGSKFYALFPNLSADLSGFANRLMPRPGGTRTVQGQPLQKQAASPLQTLLSLGKQAAQRLNQYPGPKSVLKDKERQGNQVD